MMERIRIGYIVAAIAVAGSPAQADELDSVAVKLKGPATLTGSVTAPEPAPEPSEAVGHPYPYPRPCVLLRNGNVLFGQAQQVGEFVVVRSGQGSELQLPRKEVACWAGSIRHLHQFRVDNRQPGDVNALVRDARWCLQNDLFDLAATEIQAIKKIDPANAQLESIERQLDRSTEPSPSIATITPDPLRVKLTRDVAADSESRTETFDMSSLRRFASHVQPMLLNRCGRCHQSDSSLRWSLEIPLGGARASSRMTRENLASLLQYIQQGVDRGTVFLSKATTPHGGASAPLDLRNAKAVDSLKRWLAMADSRPAADAEPQAYDSVMRTGEPLPSAGTAANPRIARRNFDVQDAGPSQDEFEQPVRLPQVANPFDPDLFNRRLTLDDESK